MVRDPEQGQPKLECLFRHVLIVRQTNRRGNLTLGTTCVGWPTLFLRNPSTPPWLVWVSGGVMNVIVRRLAMKHFESKIVIARTFCLQLKWVMRDMIACPRMRCQMRCMSWSTHIQRIDPRHENSREEQPRNSRGTAPCFQITICIVHVRWCYA